mmetsp:Transcript_5133/g.16558  ORF Transcript_5133/g.16558 Transcript_5133/m.16558 type:complete len:200 (-) Transcript_5133:501-1100(-)
MHSVVKPKVLRVEERETVSVSGGQDDVLDRRALHLLRADREVATCRERRAQGHVRATANGVHGVAALLQDVDPTSGTPQLPRDVHRGRAATDDEDHARGKLPRPVIALGVHHRALPRGRSCRQPGRLPRHLGLVRSVVVPACHHDRIEVLFKVPGLPVACVPLLPRPLNPPSSLAVGVLILALQSVHMEHGGTQADKTP